MRVNRGLIAGVLGANPSFSDRAVARIARCSPRTVGRVRRGMRAAEDVELDAVMASDESMQAAVLGAIVDQARGGDVKAAMWALETRFPSRYGRGRRRTSPDDGLPPLEPSGVPRDDELFDELAELRRRRAGAHEFQPTTGA